MSTTQLLFSGRGEETGDRLTDKAASSRRNDKRPTEQPSSRQTASSGEEAVKQLTQQHFSLMKATKRQTEQQQSNQAASSAAVLLSNEATRDRQATGKQRHLLREATKSVRQDPSLKACGLIS
jgi:hypothetical protein